MAILDQVVVVLSWSRWSSNEGAPARAGVKNSENWKGVRRLVRIFYYVNYFYGRKIAHSSPLRGRSPLSSSDALLQWLPLALNQAT